MAGSLLGTAVRRLEDPELLRGQGTYIDNLDLPGKAHVHFVRSTVAHARITGIDASEARAMDGVLAVYTAADLDLAPFHTFVAVAPQFARPPLATDTVRFVGEAVAAVVATDKRIAADAAEAVIVDYDPLPVIVDPERAFDDGQPVIIEANGSNVSFSNIDPYDDGFFADADVVVRGRYENQRVAVVPMEPNSFAAVPGEGDHLTVYASTQMPHLIQPAMSAILGLPAEHIRVIAPHVGGGFGGKAGTAPEYAVVAAAARKLGRPCTWTETRSEDMVALPHSRAQVQYVELGCKRDGTFTGLRARIIGDSGAYPGVGTMLPGGTRRMSQGNYALPKLSVDVACAVTNTTPTGAYRGAGRPEAASMVERIVDQAARELGIEPAELRRRNFLQPDQFPFVTHTGVTYDSGDYATPLDRVLELAGYDELRAEQRRRIDAGATVLLGVGLSSYVEITAGGNSAEFGAVAIDTDGGATIRVGTSAHGQGHATSFAMIVSDRLGIPLERITFVQSDTDFVPRGGGTGGSRSLQLGGSAIHEATEQVWNQARALAAELLECAVEDVVLHEDGRVGVAGVPATALAWAELAQRSPQPLAAELDFDQKGATFPFGAHIAVVEVDTETGRVTPIRHIAVDDAGTVLNPLILAGQQHGGVASGVSQALYEQVHYDEAGNPRTATLADYALPSAAELSSFEVHSTQTPTPLNPLGAKGIGEAGTIGATPAVQNAIVDALAHLGVRHVDMPATPERVWRTIDAARAGTLPDPWREPPAIFEQLRHAGAGAADQAAVEAAEGV
ncbi:MAG: xanthine dehydrogenase family protein molybdopterin-binding subunit [Acidimicrobiales bacterium]